MFLFWWFLIIIIVLCILGVIYQGKNHNETVQGTLDENQTYMEEIGFEVDASFDYDESIEGNNFQVFVDNHNNKLMVLNGVTGRRDILNFKDIIGMEYKEDGESTDGVGRAVTGGLLFGETGAIVGAITGKKTVKNSKIIIYVTDVVNPLVEIDINHTNNINCDGYTYKKIMEFERRLNATVKAIIAKNERGET